MMFFSLSLLCLSIAQRPPSRRCLLEACSSWLASSCAQAEFSPTTHIMKIKTCGSGQDRYCCLQANITHKELWKLTKKLQDGTNAISGIWGALRRKLALDRVWLQMVSSWKHDEKFKFTHCFTYLILPLEARTMFDHRMGCLCGRTW